MRTNSSMAPSSSAVYLNSDLMSCWSHRAGESPMKDGDLVVLDGRRILLLTQALLSPDVNHLLTESSPTSRVSRTPVDLRLSKAYVASITWRDVILPSLSRFVQYLGYQHHGPEHAITIPPNQVPSALCILEIGADLVDRLKIGKFHGVSTLHPSIFTYL